MSISNGFRSFPLFIAGTVVKGFGRGSKELGIPTANFAEEVVEQLPTELECGIYFGWASVDSGPTHKMVASIGWNPYYKNDKKSMETHLIHNFEEDFYGALLKVAILGFVRSEKNFSSVDELITAIKGDIQFAEAALNKDEHLALKNHAYFVKGHQNPSQ